MQSLRPNQPPTYNSGMTITLQEIKQFAQERLVEGLSNPKLFNERLKEVLEFAFSKEKEMDDEARAYVDSVIDGLLELMDDSIGKLPDSAHKRKMARLLALAEGKHHRADKLAEGLGNPAPKLPIAEAAKPIFLRAVQSLLDILFDVTRHSSKGSAQFATLTMLYWCVDELNVAFFLAERKCATQAYSHIRTVHDLLGKIELFSQQPHWADVWGGEDERKILKELSPAAVREKLGRARFDPSYSLFSKSGSHGTFEGVRRRVLKHKKESDRVELTISIGGVPWDSEVVFSISMCLFAVNSTLVAAVQSFPDRLHHGEMLDIAKATTAESVEFLEKHFARWMQEEGLDASELLKSLEDGKSLFGS